MLNLVLKRTYFKDATIGVLYPKDKDNPVLHTIEKPWLNNEVKKSCIPEGVYEVLPYSSEKYPSVWELQNVKGRSKILIHTANWEHELQGCIAVGLASGYMYYQKEQRKAVTSSVSAISQLKKLTEYPKPFKLEIVS